MVFLVSGLILLLLKYAQIGWVADWSWWWVLSPFAMAVAWWTWADNSGYTRRKVTEKLEDKKRARIEKQRAALGIKPPRR